ncbi:hypothetical protein LNQ49_03750 [Flavobacterium sp. F-65]|uniref:Lipocalin-like domain-containing protein n=1 Tax=Flavobacterium pisciphilum TaxID=2893755 RepID=A0ABS8MPM6_9FLAO|nr:hypothetical protein [Flavobacterium sp. F-65]MCC9070715.1 hypothetical protein [Flavobacterium sp. F-65]
MKNILNLVVPFVVLLTIVNCEKKPVSNELDGSWELRYIEGIQVADADPVFKPGNGNLLKFEGHKYERYSEGNKEEDGTFTISPEDTTINNRKANYSITFNQDAEKTYLSLLKNKLIVFNGVIAADGTESTYEKQ